MTGSGRDKQEKGFTLVEMLVVASLFILLVGGVGFVFTTMVQRHRAEYTKSALQQDVLNFLEVLDREVRTGYGTTFEGTGGTLDDGSEFCLVNQETRAVRYGVVTSNGVGRIVRAAADSTRCADPNVNGAEAVHLTSQRTHIARLSFSNIRQPTVDAGTNGAPSLLKGNQGRVTVQIRACVPNAPASECIDLQTTITSRQYAPLP